MFAQILRDADKDVVVETSSVAAPPVPAEAAAVLDAAHQPSGGPAIARDLSSEGRAFEASPRARTRPSR